MADYEYIPVDKSLIPYRFDILLDGQTLTFEIHYNATHDFFTINLIKDGEELIFGEKVVYGKVLFESGRGLGAPLVPIIPYDLSGQENRVTWNNFNETVFLWMVKDGE